MLLFLHQELLSGEKVYQDYFLADLLFGQSFENIRTRMEKQPQ
jgi:hypothetical protein